MEKKIKFTFILIVLIQFRVNVVFGQASVANNTIAATDYLGSLNNIDVLLKAGGVQYGKLLYTNGFLGIGTTFTPIYKLDVDAGDINLNTFTSAYRIGDGSTGNSFRVLWHNGNPLNIFVGVNAGNSNTSTKNTFVGYNAGVNVATTTGGNQNTFVGYEAGKNTDSGYENSFLGESAGFSNTEGYHNTFVGMNAGYSNTTGKSNTIIGTDAGYSLFNTDYNTMVGRNVGYFNTGAYNCFYGKDAGMYNRNGSSNSFYGHHSGANILNTSIGTSTSFNAFFGRSTGQVFYNGEFNVIMGSTAGAYFESGNNNVFIGGLAQQSSTTPSLNNAVVIGYQATALTDNKFILGNNNQNVGIGLSNDTWPIAYGPRSKLEINADPVFTSYTGTGAYGSGLQFRQLTSTTPISAANYISPYGKVLTVDAEGIVKLTDDKGDFGYGECINPTSLPSDIGMKLRDYRIYYEDQGYTERDLDMNNAIGLGYNCGDVLPGKLSVNQLVNFRSVNSPTVAGFFRNGDLTTDANLPSFAKRSLYVICDGYSPFNEDGGITNVAGDFVATNAEYLNIAVRGRTGIHSPVDTYGEYSFGGYFEAKESTVQNVGVCAITDGKGSTSNYGIYAQAPIGFCTTGSCSDAAGFFNGDLYHSGGIFTSSDLSLKDNIQSLQNSLSIVNALNPKTYSFRNSQFPYLNLPSGTQEGLIAQEVQTVLPHLVKNFSVPARLDSLGNLDDSGASSPFMAVNYVGIIPYLIGAIKEQQQDIDSLRLQLEEVIDNCCGANQRSSGNNGVDQEKELEKSTINIELSNTNTIILDQNSPNPFSEETVINYVIPKEVVKALIMIYDNSGQVLKTVIINERGPGSLHIYAENLSSGIYSYTLIADGVKVDSKQMVCQK